MDIMKIGENAGKVWRVLANSENGVNCSQLNEATGLKECDIAAAIGWLAREDKIWINEENDTFVVGVYREFYY